eukprot:scaffold3319_cov258-Pinguiococcus_pyrenoidosus.AAC.16
MSPSRRLLARDALRHAPEHFQRQLHEPEQGVQQSRQTGHGWADERYGERDDPDERAQDRERQDQQGQDATEDRAQRPRTRLAHVSQVAARVRANQEKKNKPLSTLDGLRRASGRLNS